MQASEFREPTHEEICQKAYCLWQAEGSPAGQADKNWFAAETQLMQRQAAEDGTTWVRVNEDLPTAQPQLG